MNPKSPMWSAYGVLSPAPNSSDNIRTSTLYSSKAEVHVPGLLQIKHLGALILKVSTFWH